MEKRSQSLAETLKEKELNTTRQQLEGIQHLMAILTEMVQENEEEDESEETVNVEIGRPNRCSEIELKKD